MPSLGADMDEGMVVKWLVSPGDVVHRGDLVAEVETQKGIIDAEIWEDGIIEEFVVELGTTVPVGTPIATIGPLLGAGAESRAEPPEEVVVAVPAAGERARPDQVVAEHARHPTAPGGVLPPIRHLAHELGVDLDRVVGTGENGEVTRADIHAAAERPTRIDTGIVRASPFARRTAEELGVDISTIRGSGPAGAVVRADLDTDPVREAPTPADERYRAMRDAIATLMTRSKREVPHYYLGHHIDLSAALGWLESHNADRPVTERLLPASLLLKASAVAARAVPEVNGFWIEDHFEPSESVHLGVAISLRQGGLIAPAILDADQKSLPELMTSLRDLVSRTRNGKLRSSEMTASTITVTNLGDQGVEEVYGVIYVPQVALVGFGKIIDRPWAENGMVGARPSIVATLSADHRASDGHTGGRYLTEIQRLLDTPEEL